MGLVTNAFLGLILIPIYSLKGAAISTVCGHFILMVLAGRMTGINLTFQSLFIKQIIAGFCFTFACYWFALNLHPSLDFSSIVIGLLLFIVGLFFLGWHPKPNFHSIHLGKHIMQEE